MNWIKLVPINCSHEIDNPSSSLYNKQGGILTPDFIKSDEITKQEIDIVKTDYNKNSNKVIQFSYTRRIKDKIKNFFNVNKI